MTPTPTNEKAIEWLTEQLESLRQFRNANTRDQGFRQWRQDTLTVVQRIWPQQQGKWTRFRSVPFAPPNPKADEKAARNSFEHGYAEMRRLLKMWIEELKLSGVPVADTPPPPKPAPPPASGSKGKKRLKDMLGFAESSKGAEAPSESAKPATDAAASGAEEQPPAVAEKPASPAPSAAEQGPDSDVPPQPQEGLTRTLDDALERALGASQTPAASRRGNGKASRAAAGGGSSSRTSGSGSRGGTGSRPRTGGGLPHPLVALVANLGQLGVPTDDREGVGKALVDLAKHLESGAVSWRVMQEAVALVMEYPALARRALPLLIQHLDAAA